MTGMLMNRPSMRRDSIFGTAWRIMVHRKLPLETETAQFMLVSFLDFVMTFRMISTGRFTEANVLARFFLDSWGPMGMLYFKMAIVGVVAVLAQVIACKNLTTARKLLNTATVVMALVVIYSLFLLLHGLELI
jgi:hypothetical protein